MKRRFKRGQKEGGERRTEGPAEGVKGGMVEREQEAEKWKERAERVRQETNREHGRSSQDKWHWLDNGTAHTVLETLITQECFSTL